MKSKELYLMETLPITWNDPDYPYFCFGFSFVFLAQVKLGASNLVHRVTNLGNSGSCNFYKIGGNNWLEMVGDRNIVTM